MRTRVSVAGTAGRAPPLGDHHGFTEDRTTDSSSHPIKGRPCLRRAVAVSAEQACARTFALPSRLTITSTQYRPANGEVGSGRHRAAKAAPSGVTEDARESLTAAKPSVKLMHPAATSNTPASMTQPEPRSPPAGRGAVGSGVVWTDTAALRLVLLTTLGPAGRHGAGARPCG